MLANIIIGLTLDPAVNLHSLYTMSCYLRVVALDPGCTYERCA
jgi:hypothetical protein